MSTRKFEELKEEEEIFYKKKKEQKEALYHCHSKRIPIIMKFLENSRFEAINSALLMEIDNCRIEGR